MDRKERLARHRKRMAEIKARNLGWLEDWYENSPSGSVLDDYRNGNVQIIETDKPKPA